MTSATEIQPAQRAKDIYSLYYLIGKTIKQPYYGITNNPSRRQSQHRWRRKDITINLHVIMTGLTKDQARLAETTIIAAYTIPRMDNNIYSIAMRRLRDGEFNQEIKDIWYNLSEAIYDMLEIETGR